MAKEPSEPSRRNNRQRDSTARRLFHIPTAANHPGALPTMAAAHPRRWPLLLQLVIALGILLSAAEAWTGEIRGRVVCDVCGDAAIGPEDHALEGQSAPYTCLLSPLRRALWFPS